MTWEQLVYHAWGPCAKEDCEALLWNATCFPMGSPIDVACQLREMKRRSHGNVGRALELADKDRERALRKLRRRELWDFLRNSLLAAIGQRQQEDEATDGDAVSHS